ncbi:MAG: hypothetical protein AAF938_17100 [Myxococcota bacterium]
MKLPLLAAAAFGALAGGGAVYLQRSPQQGAPDRSPAGETAAPPFDVSTAFHEGRLDASNALIVGGGSSPASSPVSLAQDLVHARDRLSQLGLQAFVLHGGGDGSPVAVQDEAPGVSPIADFFDPRDRSVAYRSADLRADGPADAAVVLDALRTLAARDEALTFFLAAHGDPEGFAYLWGESTLDASQVAEALGSAPARVIVKSCFGGAFGALAYESGIAGEGPAAGRRCGFFATTADLEASGCDPNPQRGEQEGYVLHFLEALHGVDRAGEAIAVDYDGDERISLLEAHTRARIATRSLDVPTTTSEFFLRTEANAYKALSGAQQDAYFEASPEDDAVITALRGELSVSGRGELNEALAVSSAQLETVAAEADRLTAERDAAYAILRADLLARWPLLDDPWHPDHAALLDAHAPAIESAIEQSALGQELRALDAQIESAIGRYTAIELGVARLRTLQRAEESARMRGFLRATAPERFAEYERLVGCERGELMGPGRAGSGRAGHGRAGPERGAHER